MAYIGKAPINGFHAKQSLTGDGSTVTFTLDQTVATETALIVSVGGVIQEPSVAYNLTIGGTKITFTEAPSSTDTVYIQFLGTAIVQNLLDVAGAEFVLDANGNTSFTADTDDEIDIKVGGSDINTIKATGFHNLDNIKFVAGTGDDMQMYHDGTNSYLTNSEGALKIATETSSIAVTIGHTTSEVTIADNATVAGNLTVTGTLTQTGTQTFDGGIDVDNFNINGTTIALSSGDMLLDSAGDIILDADGGDVFFKDAGTTFGSATNTSGNLIIKSGTTTALTFAGANATLAGTLGVGAVTSTGIVTGTAFTAGSAVLAEAELELLDGLTAGTAIASKVVTTDANIDTTGQRNLTISGELDAATGDFSGDVDIDGTLEADAITVNGTALASVIAGTTVNLATLASTVTITDNESTDENNAVIFAAGGDVDGGSLGLESDGDLTYNPSTGTLNVTNISVTGTQTIVNSVTMNASNAVIFEGATADAHETTLSTVDATADRTINLPNQSGTIPVLAAASATAITSTPEELNLLDGVSGLVQADLTKLAAVDSTATELNIIDGNATVGTTAVADGDGIVTNDGGTMRQTTVQTFATYFGSEITAMSNLVTTGALDSGSITSGFGAIDNGTSNIRSATITAETAFVPDAADGATLGTASLEFSDLYLANAGQVIFGNDQDITITHVDEVGLIIKNATTADDKPLVLTLQTGETDIAADDVLGSIRFQAPDEGTGTDAILVAAAIEAVSEGDFSSSNNATKLSFKTGASEAATEKMTLSSTGVLTANVVLGGTDTDTSNTGNVELDFSAKQNFVLTLTGNTTLTNPSTENVGQSGFIAFIQDGTGGRTITLGTDYETAGGAGITLTTAASTTDLVPYVVVAANRILLGQPQKAFS
jgi:hypothetical protein